MFYATKHCPTAIEHEGQAYTQQEAIELAKRGDSWTTDRGFVDHIDKTEIICSRREVKKDQPRLHVLFTCQSGEEFLFDFGPGEEDDLDDPDAPHLIVDSARAVYEHFCALPAELRHKSPLLVIPRARGRSA